MQKIGYDTATAAMPTDYGVVQSRDLKSDKDSLLACEETARGPRGHAKSSGRFIFYVTRTFLAIALLVAITGNVRVIITDTKISTVLPASLTVTPANELAKYAAPVPVATATSSSAPVLRVFQVHQPILTPEGSTNQTVASEGISNTTSLSGDEVLSSCTQVLMYHSFGNSYGQPFVGE